MLDGRLIAISTSTAPDEQNENRQPDEAKLFVFDVTEQKIVREIVPLPKARTTGLIVEVTPGRLLGLTSDRQDKNRSILYGVDVATGQTLFTKGLPSRSRWTITGRTGWILRTSTTAFERGPDGWVWTWLKDVLVRIDSKDARVQVVGKVDPVGWPTFVGKDVYLSGSETLRRIRKIVPSPK